jgi:hypothetical protein
MPSLRFIGGFYQSMVKQQNVGYPDESTLMLGLLLISEKHQRKGLGTKA